MKQHVNLSISEISYLTPSPGKLKILIACEDSGITSAAFSRLGHTTVSCDFLPSASCLPHYLGDVLDLSSVGFDLMIAYPPCTHLCIASAWRWAYDRENIYRAMLFIESLTRFNVAAWCIENPVGILNRLWRAPDQIISPHYFGSRFQKRTCLYLFNLPPLLFGPKVLNPRHYVKQWGANHNKSKLRSKSHQAIAAAMAQQWGSLSF